MTNCCFRTGEGRCHAKRKKAPAKKIIKKLNPNPRKDADLKDLQADKEREAARFQTEETARETIHTNYQFYKDIILFKGGAKAMEIYKALHPNGKFRD